MIDLLEIKIILGRPSIIYISMVLFMFIEGDAKKPIVKRSNSSLRIQRKKSSQPLKSPADRILFLQQTTGNQAVQRLIKSGTLQAKLKIGQPGDKYEQEADRGADAVMRMPDPGVQWWAEEEKTESQVGGF